MEGRGGDGKGERSLRGGLGAKSEEGEGRVEGRVVGEDTEVRGWSGEVAARELRCGKGEVGVKAGGDRGGDLSLLLVVDPYPHLSGRDRLPWLLNVPPRLRFCLSSQPSSCLIFGPPSSLESPTSWNWVLSFCINPIGASVPAFS